MQAARRAAEPPVAAASPPTPVARIGFTVTKKVGNAVERNRIRRRLREAVRLSETLPTEAETDYVLVARREALSLPFRRLIADLEVLMRKAGAARPGPASGGRGRSAP